MRRWDERTSPTAGAPRTSTGVASRSTSSRPRRRSCSRRDWGSIPSTHGGCYGSCSPRNAASGPTDSPARRWGGSSKRPRRGGATVCSSAGREMALLLALLSALFYGTADFLGGVAARRSAALAATALAQGEGLVVVALAVPFFPGEPLLLSEAGWGAGAGLTGAVGVALLYYGLAVGRVSVVAPVTAVCAIAIPVVVAGAMGERPGPLAVCGIGAAVLSVGLISRGVDPAGASRTTARDRSIWIALASGVAIGAFFVCLARAGTRSGLWPLLVARAVSTALLASAALMSKAGLRLSRAALVPAVACGALDMVATTLYVRAAGTGPLGLVATLASLYPASTVLLARVVLGERLRGVQSLGLACATVAVVLITI